MRFYNPTFLSRCPHCSSVDFRSVGVRNALERALYWLLRPQRCGLCGHHFFLLRWLVPVSETT
jgi:hypothetical protein